MPRAKTHAFKGKVFSELPQEIVNALGIQPGDEIEYREIAKGVVAVYSAGNGPSDERMLVEKEIDVMRKVNNIYSGKRTVEYIESVLAEDEKNVFKDLLKRRVFFKYKKNGKELVGLDKRYLPLVLAPKKEEKPLDLWEKGYAIVENEKDVEELSRRITEEGREDQVRGVRGFDQKYYIVTNEKLSSLEWRLLNALDGKKTLEEVAKELGENPELVRACVEVLREEGKILERRKELYERV